MFFVSSFTIVAFFYSFSLLNVPSDCETSLLLFIRAGRYEVDGYVYNGDEEPKILMTGKWNEFMNFQPCDLEGEPLPGTKLEEVSFSAFICMALYINMEFARTC